MASPVIQFKRGAFANLPGLQAGEPALTTDTFELYVGINSTTGGNKFFGSHRYWTREGSSTGSSVNLVEGSSNGSSYVALKSPDSLAANVTYTLPGSDGTNGQVLVTNGSGTLSFTTLSSSLSLAGDSGTDTLTVGSDTLTFTGGTGISATVTNNQVSYGLDAELQALSSVTSAANKLPYFTGSGTASVTDLSSFGRTLIDDADAATARTTLGVDAAGTDNSTDVTLAGSYDYLTLSSQQITLGQIDLTTDVTGTLPLANGGIGATTAAGARTNLGLVIGTNVQAHDDILDDLSGLTQAANKLPYFDSSTTAATTDLSAFGRTLIDDADAATARTTLDVDQAGTDNSTDVTLAGSYDYLTISGQAITLGQIDLTTDVTGALPNGNLANSTITVSDGSNSTATALGGTITFSGTNNEVTVVESSGTVTVGLPDNVTVSQNLTVSGNLYVNGSTTQVNTSQTTIEDQLLELGMVDGSAPSSDLNKDLGVLFNYYSGTAKKAAVYWDDSTSRVVLSDDVSESSGVLTAASHAAVEIGALWVNDCAGQTQVISCSGSTRSLENITIDGGTF